MTHTSIKISEDKILKGDGTGVAEEVDVAILPTEWATGKIPLTTSTTGTFEWLDNDFATTAQNTKFYSVISAIQPITDGAILDQYETSTNKINNAYAKFGAATTSSLMFYLGIDGIENNSITVSPVFDSDSTGEGTVAFTFSALNLSDGSEIDSSFGSFATSVDTYQGQNKYHKGPVTTVTPSGSLGTDILLKVNRGSDTLDTGSEEYVRLLGIWVGWNQ